jgi:anaerobic magnesium-protoporphyrin IX monomethyl ester cyclase
MKILLLNPPGDKIYLRDYYCSKVSKADYIYEPPDLLMLSGILRKEHALKAIDAIAMHWDEKTCLEEIRAFSPEAVIFITGAVSYKKDADFLRTVKRVTSALMIGSGDIFLEGYIERLRETDFLDAILLDFTDDSILGYLRGERPCRNIVSKDNAEVRVGAVVRGKGMTFTIPEPDHTLFPLKKYNYPFVHHAAFATVLTDYGCPYKCTFCIMSRIGFKVRDVEGVVEELRTLKKRGIREIYFDDQTFGASRPRTIKLLDRMIEENLKLGWCCFTRVDVLDAGLLQKMKQAGCHTIMFGVESADQGILDKHAKGITVSRILEVIRLCQQERIMTLATFIIGLPGDTKETIETTIRFALSSGCDFASFNIAVPRSGTVLREDAIRDHLIDAGVDEMDQSGNKALLPTAALSLAEIEALKNKAVKMFYGRPVYLLKQVLNIRSMYDLKRKISGFVTIMKGSRSI